VVGGARPYTHEFVNVLVAISSLKVANIATMFWPSNRRQQMAKTIIQIGGNQMTIDTEANVSAGWRVWLAALAFTVAGIGGFMALFSWLLG
jgi:hypothetical protein